MRKSRTPRRVRRVSGVVLVVAFVSGLLAHVAPPAHALNVCSDGATCLAAVDDNYTTGFNVKLTVDAAHGLLANDSGPSTTSVNIDDSDTTSWNGADVVIHANGSFTYTPDPTNPYSGDDSFSYEIQDNGTVDADTDDATANIVVIPQVGNDTYYVSGGQTLNVAAPGIFANDFGVDTSSVITDDATAQGVVIDVGDDGSFSYTPPAGFTGIDTFSYDVTDIDFDNDYTATVSIHVDSTPPVVSMPAPTLTTLTTKIPVSWTGSDASGITQYSVQQDVAPWNAPFGGWTNYKAPTAPGSATVTGAYGRTYCYRTQATDKAGNLSAWAQRCTNVPLRAASLTYSANWLTQNSTVYFGGTGKYTKTKGATITRTGVQGRYVYLIATECPTCGTVQVRWNGAATANVNLAHATTVHKVAILVATFSATRIGTPSIVVTSATGKLVDIEGLGVLRA